MRVSSIKARMLAVFALQAFALAVLAMIAIRSVGLLNENISELYQDRLVPVSQLAEISDLMHDCIEQLTIAVIARPSPQNVQKIYIDRVDANLARIDGLVKDYSATVVADGDRKTLNEWMSLRDVLKWKVGSKFMLNATPDSGIDLRCGDITMFRGRMGRKGQHIAIRVDDKVIGD